mmetsp:Transcript_31065/g.29663  ORF Transcript_31065/g.29663 Transcript_31065/m.29663 type:complete len:90 (-) Transcript_31065:560-829(-)
MFIFPTIPLAADATLETIADPKESHENESSVNDAIATPPITGRRERYTGIGKKDFKNTADNAADTAGSAAFTICVKLTAPAPRDITAPK